LGDGRKASARGSAIISLSSVRSALRPGKDLKWWNKSRKDKSIADLTIAELEAERKQAKQLEYEMMCETL
jgi:hypothetical protein